SPRRPRAGRINMKRWVRRMLPAMLRLGTALGDGNQFAEGSGVANRQIGQHLSIDVDAGQLETMHELVVGHPLAAGCGVDPGDPELAHVALAGPPVAVGVLERVQQGLVRGPEQGPVRHPEALGQIQDLLVATAGGDAARLVLMVPRSSNGMRSMVRIGLSSSAIRAKSFLPISWCTISRPRNMMVSLTLSPSSRNDLTAWNFVWKSCSPILGRSFISL